MEQPLHLTTFNGNGGKIGDIQLGNEVLDYDVSGNQALIAADDSIFLVDLSRAHISSTIPVDEPVLRVSFFGSKNICLVTSAGVREITL